MKKLRSAIFYAHGIVGMLQQWFGLYIILLLIGKITHTWIAEIVIGVILTLVDYWKVRYYRSEDYMFNFGGFSKKDKEDEEEIQDDKVVSINDY